MVYTRWSRGALPSLIHLLHRSRRRHYYCYCLHGYLNGQCAWHYYAARCWNAGLKTRSQFLPHQTNSGGGDGLVQVSTRSTLCDTGCNWCMVCNPYCVLAHFDLQRHVQHVPIALELLQLVLACMRSTSLHKSRYHDITHIDRNRLVFNASYHTAL